MTDINQAAPATPAQILVATPQPDDAGAETNDRYDWQAALATVHILSAYFDLLGGGQVVPNDAALELICEHHEDWAITDGYDAEIVSAKHHETAFGAYTTLRKLMDEGGLHHLFERWIALQRSPRCRLVTTPGLSGDARRLEAACAHFSDQPDETVEVGEWQELLDDLAKVISEFRLKKLEGADPEATPESVPTESVGTIVAFLRILRIDHGQPRREHLPYMAGNAFAMPVAAALGRPDAADAIWQALLQVVRERMRAAGPTLRAALPTVLGAKDEDGFEARSLTLNEVQVIVTVALANPAGYRPLPRRLKTSKVAVKMSVGGCSDNAIERAESLRLQYLRHWRQNTSGPSRAAARQRVVNVLQRVVDDETELVRNSSARWGPALWGAVQRRLESVASTARAQGLDEDLLLGGIADLANNCKVWFSPDFDADELARRLAEDVTS